MILYTKKPQHNIEWGKVESYLISDTRQGSQHFPLVLDRVLNEHPGKGKKYIASKSNTKIQFVSLGRKYDLVWKKISKA